MAIAKRLGCQGLVIPEVGAALSAAGAMMSDLHADYRSMFFTITDRFDFKGANAVLRKLDERCRAFIKGPGKGAVESATEFYVEARYKHQIWEIDLGAAHQPLPLEKTWKERARRSTKYTRRCSRFATHRPKSSSSAGAPWRGAN